MLPLSFLVDMPTVSVSKSYVALFEVSHSQEFQSLTLGLEVRVTDSKLYKTFSRYTYGISLKLLHRLVIAFTNLGVFSTCLLDGVTISHPPYSGGVKKKVSLTQVFFLTHEVMGRDGNVSGGGGVAYRLLRSRSLNFFPINDRALSTCCCVPRKRSRKVKFYH